MAALAYSPQTPHAKAGQTQITLLGTSITGSVFALAHCVEKYFYEIRIGATYSECVCVCYECVCGDTSVTEWNKLLRNEFKAAKQISKVGEKRAESLVTTSIPTGTPQPESRSKLPGGLHCAIACSPPSAAAAMLNSRWTRLYLWELSRSGHVIGRGQRSIFGRLLKPGLGCHRRPPPPHVWE